jgi:diphosphoinositol-polyphosphate diphosphatase
MLDELQVAVHNSPSSRPFLRQSSSSNSMEGDKIDQKPSMAVSGMPTEDLQALCFPTNFSLGTELPGAVVIETATNSTVVSEDETDPTSNENKVGSSSSSGIHTVLSLQELQDISTDANSRVSKEITSRVGSTQQRWAMDPQNGRSLRLVAGCVPILSDGRIILINSNKGKGWLVPKGGWELDERLEEGAIRECFEEAGLLGILGPKFDAFCVETKKAKKRRMELEEKLRQRPETPAPDSDLFYSGWSVLSQLSEEDHLTDETSYASEEAFKSSASPFTVPAPSNTVSPAQEVPKTGVRVTFQLADSERGPIPCVLDRLVPAVDVIKTDTTEETASTSSLTHTHTCMTFLPLYVQQVYESWPESERVRRAFDIDGRCL